VITAVDTDIFIDILEGDVAFGAASAAALARAARDGALVACEAVWAEVATAYAPDADVANDLRALGLRFLPMSEDVALRAAFGRATAGAARAVASRRTSSSVGMPPARRTACSRATRAFTAPISPTSGSTFREPGPEHLS